jgi:hypothetical protein
VAKLKSTLSMKRTALYRLGGRRRLMRKRLCISTAPWSSARSLSWMHRATLRRVYQAWDWYGAGRSTARPWPTATARPGYDVPSAFECNNEQPVHMIRLTKEQSIAPYVWTHPDDDERR